MAATAAIPEDRRRSASRPSPTSCIGSATSRRAGSACSPRRGRRPRRTWRACSTASRVSSSWSTASWWRSRWDSRKRRSPPYSKRLSVLFPQDTRPREGRRRPTRRRAYSPDLVRLPDVSFISWDRYPEGEEEADPRPRPGPRRRSPQQEQHEEGDGPEARRVFPGGRPPRLVCRPRRRGPSASTRASIDRPSSRSPTPLMAATSSPASPSRSASGSTRLPGFAEMKRPT